VLSRYMHAELVALGCPAGRVHVTPPWAPAAEVDAAEVGTADDGPRLVLFAGRLAASKGVADALAAWRRAQIDLPLVFAGTGPLRAALEREGFEVLGWLERTRLLAVMRRAAALLMPSRWQEPFGIVGLEALSRGVPVVAWDSGGIAEWHPGPLAPWGDVPALAELLRQALRSPARSTTRAGFTREDGLRALGHAYHAVRTRAAADAAVKGPG
jgi:glycosyltransferase involved in cell wall biosynthesis